ncbi:hypothetical protein CAC42_4612 [Sphaceloma murrayae]|uniref:Phosphatidylinositol-specific phospholipase C X domain-containing protein n=1 Tax=Sphaceloma murrayae TaxID=2082308 RepID=A0A2K1QND8_9PEZI|nr:hypothetical protein CAC42_4612 [Sphaceloma murrayae]
MDLRTYGTFLNEKAHQSIESRRRRRRARASAPIDLSTWMSNMPDAAPISSLTIPGTHDSAAYDVVWPFVATQSLTLEEQLLSGIRYFDFRCGLVKDVLEMVHGRALLGRTLSSCLEILYAFLATHPSEALIVQLKQDRAPESSTIPFPTAVWSLLSPSSRHWRLDPTTPSLADLRSKIQLLRRFPGPPYHGIDVLRWQDNPDRPFTIKTWSGIELVVQDHYNPSEPTALPDFVERKAADVTGMLDLAARDPDLQRWYINFVSGYEFNLYFQASPHDVAVGGWWYYRWVEGVNRRVVEWLGETKGRRTRTTRTRTRYGIVVMDYPQKPDGELLGFLVGTNSEKRESKGVSARAVLAMALVLLVIFVGGCLLVLIHGPAEGHYWCPPSLHACALRGPWGATRETEAG